MVKKPVEPATHQQMIREYPIANLTEGWYFRVNEISAGLHVVEGKDIYGYMVSRQAHNNLDAILAECVHYARELSKTN